jgi:hypothetical protein
MGSDESYLPPAPLAERDLSPQVVPTYDVEPGGLAGSSSWWGGFGLTVRARPGRFSALSVSHCISVLYGTFVWAGRALNNRKWRFLARAALRQADQQ